VSETAQALRKLWQKSWEGTLEEESVRRPRKTDTEGANVTCWGGLFQVRAAATGKARSPKVDSRVLRTVRKRIEGVSGSWNRTCIWNHPRCTTVMWCPVHKNSDLELDPL